MRSSRAVDQLINSGSSALYAFGLVAVTDDRGLGMFALQLTPLALLLGLARTAVYEGILIHTQVRSTSSPIVTASLTGLAAGCLGFVLTLGTGQLFGATTDEAVAIAAVSFAVLFFDGLRFASFSVGRAWSAAVGDSVWLVVLVVLITINARVGTITGTSLSWIYAAAAVIGALPLGLRLFRLGPWNIRSVMFPHVRFGADFLLQVVPAQLALVLAALSASLDAVGVLRAAVTMFSPLATVVYAVRLGILGHDAMTRSASRPATIYGVVSATYAIALVAAFAVVPQITSGFFGAISSAVLVLVGVGEVGRHMTQAHVDVLRHDLRLRPVLLLRGTQSVLLVSLSVALGFVAAEVGLSAARAVAFCVPVAVAWLWLSRPVTDHRSVEAK